MVVHIDRSRQLREVRWDGNTKSDAVKIESGQNFSIYLPAGFAGTTLTFESRENQAKSSDSDPDIWAPVYVDNGAASVLLTVRVTKPGRTRLPPDLLCGLDTIRLVSSASETIVGWMGVGQ